MQKLLIWLAVRTVLLGAASTFMLGSAVTLAGEENPPQDNRVITACHATWGKLGGEDLPFRGIHAHFIEAVFARAGYEVKTEITNWARCVEMVKSMKYDFTMAWESEEFDSYPTGKVNVLFPMLENGRLDALIMDPSSVDDEVNANFPHLKERLRILQPPIQVNIASPAISRNHPRLEEFREAYEKAYGEMVNAEFVLYLEESHDMRVIR